MINEELTFKVRCAIFTVYRELGPGMLESVYERALAIELMDMGLAVQAQVPVPVHYKGHELDIGFRLDLVVNDQVIIEVKSVQELHDIHKKQLLNYLKITSKRVGILINFNAARIRNKIDLVRIVN